jgi:hypothetical protein
VRYVVAGAARARWPSRSSKPVSRRSPSVGRFDSCAAPYPRNCLHLSGFFHRLGYRSVCSIGDGRLIWYRNLVPVRAPQPPFKPLSLLPEHFAGQVDVGLGRLEGGVTRTSHERRRRGSSRRRVRDRRVPQVVERPHTILDLGPTESKPKSRRVANDVKRRALRGRAEDWSRPAPSERHVSWASIRECSPSDGPPRSALRRLREPQDAMDEGVALFALEPRLVRPGAIGDRLVVEEVLRLLGVRQ